MGLADIIINSLEQIYGALVTCRLLFAAKLGIISIANAAIYGV